MRSYYFKDELLLLKIQMCPLVNWLTSIVDKGKAALRNIIKPTLLNILFEQSFFTKVTILSKDMATHKSNVGLSMEKYAERSVATVARSPGARDRSLQILSFLGRLDEDEVNKNDEDDTDGEEYDPWASANSIF